MKYLRLFIAVVSPLLVTLNLEGCTPSNSGSPISWQAIELQGKRLELIDAEKIETYEFGQNGVLAATLGQKGGAITGPVLYWKIENGILLLSEDPNFKAVESFASPLINGDVVTVPRTFLRWDQFKLSK